MNNYISLQKLDTIVNKDLLVKHTGTEVKKIIIWLHGLGADNQDFIPFIDTLNLDPQLGISILFPNAPVRPVSLHMGVAVQAWFDIYSIGGGKEDEEGIKEAASTLSKLINTCIDLGINSKQILLAGFSQGGALALYTGLNYIKPLGGIIGLSTYLPLMKNFDGSRHKLPIFLAHGAEDPIVLVDYAIASKELLQQHSDLEWYNYPGLTHCICSDETEDLVRWLKKTI